MEKAEMWAEMQEMKKRIEKLESAVRVLQINSKVLCGDGKWDYVHNVVEEYALERARKKREAEENHVKEDSCAELKNIPTAQLVQELRSRDGVNEVVFQPHEKASVEVEGPATVLVVTD